jgi:hypothetical protein
MLFTTRDVFLTTAIVALAVGWWLDRSQLERQRSKAQESSESARFVLDELMKTFDTVHPGWRGAKWAEMPEEHRRRMAELDKDKRE